jgi:ribosomal protein S18 acetylase RimI-like enzyme
MPQFGSRNVYLVDNIYSVSVVSRPVPNRPPTVKRIPLSFIQRRKDGMPATVHRVTVPEAARIRALRLEMLADSPLAFLETLAQAAARPHADYRRRITQVATGDQQAPFVAELDGRLVGNAGGSVWLDDPDSTLLFAVYVSPSCRGTGVLEQLVEAVAGWSRAAGRHRLVLEVVAGNDRAIRAYRRVGFAETGERNPHPRIPGLVELVMARDLWQPLADG